MIRGVLLDFYGTVVAEDDPIVAGICARAALAGPGVTATAVGRAWWRNFQRDMARYTGARFRSQREIALRSLAEALAEGNIPGVPEELCAPQFGYWRRPALLPDAREFLTALRALDVPVCVLSNIDRADVLAAIAHCGLPLDTVVSSEDARCYKPAGAMFAAGLAALGLAAREVLHIGDSLAADVRGARAAGIDVVWLNRAGRPLPADLAGRPGLAVAGSLVELLPRLRPS